MKDCSKPRTLRAPDQALESKDEGIIFGERNGIYIVDLQKTLKLFKMQCDLSQNGLPGQEVSLSEPNAKPGATPKKHPLRRMFYVNPAWLERMPPTC